MKKFGMFVSLFVISMLLFFIGTAISNVPMVITGIALTLVLFAMRRSFIPRQ